jgi:hypothetical protein
MTDKSRKSSARNRHWITCPWCLSWVRRSGHRCPATLGRVTSRG